MKKVCFAAVCLLAAMLAALVLAGCEGRELCYDHSHKVQVSIEFDWSLAPDATPETMVVWFFPLDGSQGLRYELTGDGNASRYSMDAVVKVPVGTYRMVCHNGNTEFNIERGSGIGDYVVTTYDVEVLSAMNNRNESAPLPEDMPVRAQASTLYAHTLDEPMTVVNDSKIQQKVVFRPEETSVVCNVVISNVRNLTPEVMASAIISGAAEGWHAGSHAPTEERVAVPFELVQTGDDTLQGSVVLFGVSGVKKLRIYTSYKYYYDFDISDQIIDQEGKHYINIDLSGIKLPENPGSGMSPGVSDWADAIEETITM